ncbi:hypothetical protein AVEN_187447-1 [Araneus ventricosus]|uniref:Uncharacterized protein n=1 Tax=Araneus ventricosus TaxID=182803 RepID=A0A4Y2BS95_ARAVE|nr:hypothetical protein AVEN_187447-1 [Araneus ventricosus]
MARARDTLSGAKHRRKRPLQRCQVTCLGRDSNERPNRPLRVRWGFRHSCPISRRNPTPFCAAFYRCNGYRLDIAGRSAIQAARHPPRAPTGPTTGMGITATTSDQRHYCGLVMPDLPRVQLSRISIK